MNLRENEKLIKEYERFYLIEVLCPYGRSYKKTVEKWKRSED